MSKTNTVSPLRQRMIEDMAARKLNPHTQSSHIYSCKRFAAWLKRSPDTATADEVRRFQLHLIESGASICNRNRIMTGVRFLFRVTLRRHAIDGGGALWAGEEAVVADAMEAARQHVQEEAADELGGVERHRLDPGFAGRLAAAIVLPLEGDALVVEPDQTCIRDGDAVGVARQIGEDGLGSGERPFGVDHPLAAAQRRERGVEGASRGERGEIAEEG